MHQNMSLQSHYVKCHRYEVMESPKCTYFHPKKFHTKLSNEETSGNLLFHYHLAGIIQGLGKNLCLYQQIGQNYMLVIFLCFFNKDYSKYCFNETLG